MTPFDLTPQARRDFNEVIDYLAEKNRAASLRWDENCIEEFFDIAAHPESSPVRAEFAAEPVRVRVFDTYLIFYDPTRQPLLILRILHARRNVAALISKTETTLD